MVLERGPSLAADFQDFADVRHLQERPTYGRRQCAGVVRAVTGRTPRGAVARTLVVAIIRVGRDDVHRDEHVDQPVRHAGDLQAERHRDEAKERLQSRDRSRQTLHHRAHYQRPSESPITLRE